MDISVDDIEPQRSSFETVLAEEINMLTLVTNVQLRQMTSHVLQITTVH